MAIGGLLSAVGVAVVVVVAWVLVARRTPKGAIAQRGRQLTAGVPPEPEAVALLERWRDRASRWRSMLAMPVVAASLVASIVLRRSMDVGIGAHPAWADPLLTGLVAVFLGAIAAELHHLRSRRHGPRTVELTPRDLADYLPAGSRRRSVLLVGVAAVVTVVAGLVAEVVPWLGFGALVVAGAVPVVQRGIVVRARPAVSPPLRASDDAVRRLAVRSVDEAGAGVVLLLTAWQLAPIYDAVAVPTALGFVLAASQLAALVVTIAWWRRSNPKRLLPDVPAALRPPWSLETPS